MYIDAVDTIVRMAVDYGQALGFDSKSLIKELSRSFYAKIIPHDKVAEFFGFYNMLGKSAVLIGPLMVGAITLWTGSNRIVMLSLLVLFIIGAILLYLVPLPPENQQEK